MPTISMFYGILDSDELMADWALAVAGETPYKIDPLR
jgi:hypothetical protein